VIAVLNSGTRLLQGGGGMNSASRQKQQIYITSASDFRVTRILI